MQKKRVTLFWLLVVFILPIFGAYLFKTHPEFLGANQTTNYGTWVKTKISWPNYPKQRAWKLVYWQPRVCDKSCFDILNQLAKIRLAMGRKLYDLDIWLYTSSDYPLTSNQIGALQQQDMRLAYAKMPQLKNWDEHFSKMPIVLISPENQALMMYSKDFIAKKMYNDLQRLMKS
jgi:hypothetical protein